MNKVIFILFILQSHTQLNLLLEDEKKTNDLELYQMLDDFNREIKHKNYLKIKKEKLTLINNNLDQKLEEIKNRKQSNFYKKEKELNEKLKLKDEHIRKILKLRRLEKEKKKKKLSDTIKKRFFSVQETLDRFLNEQEEQRLKQEEETQTKCNF